MIPSFIQQPSAEDISAVRHALGIGVAEARRRIIQRRLNEYIDYNCLNDKVIKEILKYLISLNGV